jgi:hypothetical protein
MSNLNRDPYVPPLVRNPSAKRRYFTVQGEGTFPLDMLRYDVAWAVTGIEGHAQRTVICGTLAGNGTVPTAERWASFGWIVTRKNIPPPTEILSKPQPAAEKVIQVVPKDGKFEAVATAPDTYDPERVNIFE